MSEATRTASLPRSSQVRSGRHGYGPRPARTRPRRPAPRWRRSSTPGRCIGATGPAGAATVPATDEPRTHHAERVEVNHPVRARAGGRHSRHPGHIHNVSADSSIGRMLALAPSGAIQRILSPAGSFRQVPLDLQRGQSPGAGVRHAYTRLISPTPYQLAEIGLLWAKALNHAWRRRTAGGHLGGMPDLERETTMSRSASPPHVETMRPRLRVAGRTPPAGLFAGTVPDQTCTFSYSQWYPSGDHSGPAHHQK